MGDHGRPRTIIPFDDMILPIIKLPDPRLHEPSAPVPPAQIPTPDFQEMIERMKETMEHANGVGIAGVQVGWCWRVFITTKGGEEIVIINPVILSHTETLLSNDEGCLSVPERYERVKRWGSLRMRGLNQRGVPITFKASGYFARIVQHEYDHLQGKLFIDRLNG